MQRALHAILLSLLLVVTSHSAAIARGSATAVDQVVICSGTTVRMVFIDAEGQPTAAPHLCPDCVLHLFAAVVQSSVSVTQLFRAASNAGWTRKTVRVEAYATHTSARAPPAAA